MEYKTVRLQSIKVNVKRYANDVIAQEVYEKYIRKEEKEKKRANENAIPYRKDTYFLNGRVTFL